MTSYDSTIRNALFETSAQEILPHVWLGSEDAGMAPVEHIKTHGITHVLVPAYTGRHQVSHPSHFVYMTLNLRDVAGVGILYEFLLAFKFIEKAREENGKVLVHCAQGVSRSASFVVGYIMMTKGWSYSEADNFVRKKRPVVDTDKFGDQLRIWEKMACRLEGDSQIHKEYFQKYKPAKIGRNQDVIPDNLTI